MNQSERHGGWVYDYQSRSWTGVIQSRFHGSASE
jgi:hypothetical protein